MLRPSLLLLALSCAPPEASLDDLDPAPAWELPSASQLPPAPPDFLLTAGNAVGGEVLVLGAAGAPASTALRVVVGNGGLADGACPAVLQGACLSLGYRAHPLRWVLVTDSEGEAQIGVIVPESREGDYVAMQAVWPGGPSLLSNPVGRFVGPPNSPLGEGDEDGDGYTISQGDCADFRADVGPQVVDLVGDTIDWNCDDLDGDDGDRDGLEDIQSGGTDCDDEDDTVGDQPDICDGLDNDCDGLTDDEDPDRVGGSLWYLDADGDGHAGASTTTTACTAPANHHASPTDCLDTGAQAASIGPGAPETAGDGIDQDCDLRDLCYVDADNDNVGTASTVNGPDLSCADEAGLAATTGDCLDTGANAATTFPGATELCNGRDEDCDLAVDEGASGPNVFYRDNDGDTYGDPMSTTTSCVAPSGYVTNPWDCSDTAGAVGICGSCKTIFNNGGSSGDGIYYLKPCAGGGTPTAYWCDMAHGGWTVGGWMPANSTHTLGTSAIGTPGGSDWSKDLACVTYTETAVFNRTTGEFYTATMPSSTWAFSGTVTQLQSNSKGFKVGSYGSTVMQGCVDYTYSGAGGALSVYACDNDSVNGQRGHLAGFSGEFCSGGRLDGTWAWANGSTCAYRGQSYTWGIAVR